MSWHDVVSVSRIRQQRRETMFCRRSHVRNNSRELARTGRYDTHAQQRLVDRGGGDLIAESVWVKLIGRSNLEFCRRALREIRQQVERCKPIGSSFTGYLFMNLAPWISLERGLDPVLQEREDHEQNGKAMLR